MDPNIDEEVTGLTKDVFEELLRDIEFEHLVIEALPPYVAIVDPDYWQVRSVVKCDNLCTSQSHFAMRVVLQHIGTNWARQPDEAHIISHMHAVQFATIQAGSSTWRKSGSSCDCYRKDRRFLCD